MTKSFTNQIFMLALMLSVTISYGQKEVHLKLNQFIGNTPFTIGESGTNDLGTKFNITRLDYYISSIKLHHDGGVTTNVEDKYIFVSKGKSVDELLGNFNITQLDSISFYVGVEATDNHADPSLWPAGHPLAPKSPEMHWGWAAGYRFVAIEGKSGSNLQYAYQIHGLGDELYKPTTISTKGSEQNGILTVSIDADYSQSLRGINMNKNVILHGNTKEAIPLLSNYNKYVFSAAKGTSTSNVVKIGNLKVYPNPTIDGKVTVALNESQTFDAEIIIRDALGRLVQQITTPSLQNEVIVQHAGIYTIELIQSGKITFTGILMKP